MNDQSPDHQQQLAEAFDSFREALKDALEAEAQKSIDAAIENLSADLGSFRLEGVSVEVVIREMKVVAEDPSGVGALPRGSATSPTDGGRPERKPRKRGRPAGGVRLAVLSTLEEAREGLSTAQLAESLEAHGITTTPSNLHQQLRRLVQAGEVARVARGRYTRRRPPRPADAAS